jgi:hypothetical protein
MSSWVDQRAVIISGSNDVTPDAVNQAQAEFDAGANLVKPEYVDPSVVLALRSNMAPSLPCYYYPSIGGCREKDDCTRSHGVTGVAAKYETLEERKGRLASEAVNGVQLLNLANLPERKKPCRYLRRVGGCNKGASCPFSHAPTSCKNFFSTDGCSKDPCEFSHKKLRCRHFFRAGGCRNGAACGFSHELPGPAPRVKECAYFPNGCANGAACAYNSIGDACSAIGSSNSL